MRLPPPIDPIFDRTPHPFGDGPVDPIVYDASIAALRQRTVNFAAKRYADMIFITGLDRAIADRHFRLRAAVIPAGLDTRPAGVSIQAEAEAAFAAGGIVIEIDPDDRRATVRWDGTIGHAIARPGYGTILLGPHTIPAFNPEPFFRRLPYTTRDWPIGDLVEPTPPPPASYAEALEAFFANSPGAYGVLVASPDRVLTEGYSAFGGPDRATPSWSMTKAITCTVIGRMIKGGWFVFDA